MCLDIHSWRTPPSDWVKALSFLLLSVNAKAFSGFSAVSQKVHPLYTNFTQGSAVPTAGGIRRTHGRDDAVPTAGDDAVPTAGDDAVPTARGKKEGQPAVFLPLWTPTFPLDSLAQIADM